ncbi:MAG: HypC/HybG/HupF family hydrogenase formation chaperone [archaeon]
MNPEQYFLKYALPCSYVLVDQKRLSKEEQEELRYRLLNNKEITKEELERTFTAAFRRIKELAKKMNKDYWDINVIKKYWLEEHNRYIDKNDGMYSKFSENFREICKVYKAEVIEINKNILTVSYNNKTRKVFSDLIPNVKLKDMVTIHQGYAIEILS